MGIAGNWSILRILAILRGVYGVMGHKLSKLEFQTACRVAGHNAYIIRYAQPMSLWLDAE